MKNFVCLVLVLAVLFLPVVGYVNNMVKLCHCDFRAPLKAETIRTIGIFVAPVGVIAGFCEIDDNPNIKGESK